MQWNFIFSLVATFLGFAFATVNSKYLLVDVEGIDLDEPDIHKFGRQVLAIPKKVNRFNVKMVRSILPSSLKNICCFFQGTINSWIVSFSLFDVNKIDQNQPNIVLIVRFQACVQNGYESSDVKEYLSNNLKNFLYWHSARSLVRRLDCNLIANLLD